MPCTGMRKRPPSFKRILDHRGLVGSDPIGALAHLQLGRTFASMGDTAKAKAAYQDFLTLWKNADSDLPILKQAMRNTPGCRERRGDHECVTAAS